MYETGVVTEKKRKFNKSKKRDLWQNTNALLFEGDIIWTTVGVKDLKCLTEKFKKQSIPRVILIMISFTIYELLT